MGNTMVCPVGYGAGGGTGTCVKLCPADKGFDNREVGGEARCVYTQDPTKFVRLQPAPIVVITAPQGTTPKAPSLDDLKASHPALYPAYKQAEDDFASKSEVLLGTIARETQVRDAFKELQTAEEARDTAPQAYQAARNRYYTLTKGESWIATERQRLLNAEVLPEVSPYLQSINLLAERQAQQSGTKQAVGAVKSKLLSLKDDFDATTSALSQQVTELRNQIELQKRRATTEKAQTMDWFANLLLIALAGGLIFILIRRIRGTTSPAAPAYTPPKSYR
jgi:hypothetical protein